MSSSITSKFPVIGGATMPILTFDLPMLIIFPSWEIIIQAAILSFIGAMIGYGVRFMFDQISKRL